MEDLLYQLLIHGDSAIAWIGAFVIGLLGKYVIGKMKAGTVQDILNRTLLEVDSAVAEVYQTYVKVLKDANADGVLTNDEKKAAKNMAVAAAKSYIGAKGLAALSRALGLSNIDDWLSNKVESSVALLNSKVTSPKKP